MEKHININIGKLGFLTLKCDAWFFDEYILHRVLRIVCTINKPGVGKRSTLFSSLIMLDLVDFPNKTRIVEIKEREKI